MWTGRDTIDILPDDVLLLIFHFDGLENPHWRPYWWHRLVHVCRKWRSIVFASSNFLKLKLEAGCLKKRMELIDIWPSLPISLRNGMLRPTPEDYGSLIMHTSRISRITFFLLSNSQLQGLALAMQETFPALTHLTLSCRDRQAPVFPDGFLGGSAPRLRHLSLQSISFPALPKLLLSSTGLVRLILREIPPSGYISPESIVTCLAVLPNLDVLCIGFESPLSLPDRKSRRPHLSTRIFLPVLRHLTFGGMSEDFEDIVVWIDAPVLHDLRITFFYQPIFYTPQLAQFIRRLPKLNAFREARVTFYTVRVTVELKLPSYESITLQIPCKESDLQLSSLAQVCTSCLPFLPTVDRLYIWELRTSSIFEVHQSAENTQWLELSRPFTALENLHITSKRFAPLIMPVLQALVGERVTEALPALQNVFLSEFELSGPIYDAIQQFVIARQLAGLPLTVYIGDQSIDC